MQRQIRFRCQQSVGLNRPLYIALVDTLLPDFVLAFTFFAALSYATLGRFFGRQRPAMAMSVSLGLALATGLVWWEHDHGRSIRSLGPVATGFALLIVAAVLIGAIKRQGGIGAAASLTPARH